MTVWGIAREEFRQMRRGKLPKLAILLFLPLFFTLVFGTAYRNQFVRHIPLTVFDQDQSKVSRTLVQGYADSEKFTIVSHADTQEKMDAELESGRALAALAIPAGFSKDIKRGDGGKTVLIVNSANNTIGNAAITEAWKINRTLTIGGAQRIVERLGQMPDEAMNAVYPVHLAVRLLNNPLAGFSSFMLSGLGLQGVQIALLIAAAPALSEEYRRRRYDGNVPAARVLAGKMIPYWLSSVASYFVYLAAAVFLFGTPAKCGLPELFLLGGIFSFSVIGVLFFFSALCPKPILAMQLPMLYVMPGTLFSGLSWPLFSMNLPASLYAAVMPIRYAADNLRDLLLAGYAPSLAADCRALLVCGSIGFLAAWAVFSRRRKRLLQAEGRASHASLYCA